MKIRAKLLVTILLPVLLVFAGVLGIVMIQTQSLSKKQAQAMATYLAGQQANEIKAFLERGIDTARTLSTTFEGLQEGGFLNRDCANSILKQTLESNPEFVGVWTAWEPDAFDNNDSSWVNKPGHDQTGRFVPYWSRDGNNIILQPLEGYEDPVEGEYYLLARNSGNEVITEPYDYQIAGESVWMTSLAVPIKKDGKVVGVCGVDVSLQGLQELNNQIKLFETGFGRLMSYGGIVVAHPDEARVGDITGEIQQEDGEFYRDIIQQGKEFSGLSWSISLKQNTFKTFFPVWVGGAKTPWSYGMVIREKEMMAQSNRVFRNGWIFAAAGLIGMFLLVWFFLVPLIRNIKDSSSFISQVLAKGDFSQPVSERSLALKDEFGDLSRGLDSLRTTWREILQDLFHSVEQLGEASESLSAVSGDQKRTMQTVAQGGQQVEENAENTSASIQELTSGIEEVASSAQNVSRISQELASRADETSSEAQDGGKAIDGVVLRVGETVEQTATTSQIVSQLSQRARQVAEIVGTVSSIAEQTNLLALNAAIEAARAGEAGKGFAVVADEIRKLAEESKNAAGNIARILKEIGTGIEQANNATEQTVDLVNGVNVDAAKVQTQFGRILQKVEAISTMVENLAGSAQEQSAASEEMASAADVSARSMVEVSDQVRSMVQEMASQGRSVQSVDEASTKLREISETLKKQIEQFHL